MHDLPATKDRTAAALTPALTFVLAAACMVCVANIYFPQPLLRDMALSFHAHETAAAPIAWMAQLGYAVGILLFVPLGDLLDPRRVILGLLAALVAMLVLGGLAPSLGVLALVSLGVGMFAPIAQVIVPFAAGLTGPGTRGRVLGTIQTGLILGIVSGRAVSGLLGGAAGWRMVYFAAAAVVFVLLIALARLLPRSPPDGRVTARALWSSMPGLFLAHRELRASCLSGALSGAAFSAFWTTLVFRVAAPPFAYGAEGAGLFGVLGLVVAVAAKPIGRAVDRRGAVAVNAFSAAAALGGYAIAYLADGTLAGLIGATIVLDIAIQANQISNQGRIFAIAATAASRLNTVYMTFRFSGMALGSLAGVAAWNAARWPGVCAFGVAVGLLALLLQALERRRPGVGSESASG